MVNQKFNEKLIPTVLQEVHKMKASKLKLCELLKILKGGFGLRMCDAIYLRVVEETSHGFRYNRWPQEKVIATNGFVDKRFKKHS